MFCFLNCGAQKFSVMLLQGVCCCLHAGTPSILPRAQVAAISFLPNQGRELSTRAFIIAGVFLLMHSLIRASAESCLVMLLSIVLPILFLFLFILSLNPGNNCILKVVFVWWCVSLGSPCIFFNEFMRYLRVLSLGINEIFNFQASFFFFFLNCSRKAMFPVNFFSK